MTDLKKLGHRVHPVTAERLEYERRNWHVRLAWIGLGIVVVYTVAIIGTLFVLATAGAL